VKVIVIRTRLYIIHQYLGVSREPINTILLIDLLLFNVERAVLQLYSGREQVQ